MSLFFVVQDEDLDDADGSPVDGIFAHQHQDMRNSLPAEGVAYVDAYTGDNLVTPPCKVHTIPHRNNYQVAYYVIMSKFSASHLDPHVLNLHSAWRRSLEKITRYLREVSYKCSITKLCL